MMNEKGSGTQGHGLIKVLSWYLDGETEESQGINLDEYAQRHVNFYFTPNIYFYFITQLLLLLKLLPSLII
jgi:hypothetical protein